MTSQIRMLIFAEHLWPYGSGAQLALKLLIDALKKQLAITVITLDHLSDYQKTTYYHGVNIFELTGSRAPGQSLSLLLSTLYNKKLIKKLIIQSDVVYIADTWIFPALVAKKLGKPVIKMFHSLANVNYFTAPTIDTEYSDIFGLVKAVLKVNTFYKKPFYMQLIEPPYAIFINAISQYILSRCVDVAIVPSEALKCKLRSLLPTINVVRIPNIIPNEPYIPLNKTLDRTFIYVGGKSYQKGFIHLIKAITLFTKKYLPESAISHKRIIFELINVLMDMNDEHFILGNNLKVTFRSKLSRRELMKLYRQVHVALVPSICFETFSYAAIEAHLWGRPVIATKVGGLPEIVEDKKTGILVDPGDYYKLAEAIEMFYNSDLSTIIDMGLRARERVLKAFDNQQSVKKTIKIVASLL